MEVIGKINGEQIQRDPYDLEYIEIDVVKDCVREIEHIESNPGARVEVDMTHPEHPQYELVNCNHTFKENFYQLVQENRRPA
jgi:hypothetical protein